MKRQTLLLILAIAAVVQLAVPASMILKREHALAHGQAFKFRTAPVDPYDAFRGRYVALRFNQQTVELPPEHDFKRNEKVYALIKEDEDGFARFSDISREYPEEAACLRTKIRYTSGTTVHLRLPFDRFYMEESEAPEAERIYRQNSARSNRNAYVQIRVENGFGVIEDLYINEVPIRECLADPDK
jgi:uncharacterized membrane-anchored protein